MRLNRTPHIRGFTLIELIVSLGLFTSVMLIAVGVLASVGNVSNKAQAQRSVIDNLNLAIESMARRLRVGADYYCLSSPPTGTGVGGIGARNCPTSAGVGIAFTDVNEERFGYWVEGGRIKRGQYRQGRWQSGDVTTITSSKITADSLRFLVQGAEEGDGLQPQIFMTISGTATVRDQEDEFNIQTTITQRQYQTGG